MFSLHADRWKQPGIARRGYVNRVFNTRPYAVGRFGSSDYPEILAEG